MLLRSTLLIGFVVLALISLAAEVAPPEVDLVTTDGRKVGGILINETIQLKTDYGVHEIRAKSIQRITYAPGETSGHDVIEFMDGKEARGDVLTTSIQIQSDGKIETFTGRAIREIKARKIPEVGLWALLLGLLTLSLMEIVLGIDNIIFLAIIAGKLPEAQQPKARRIGLIAALGTRILLLLSLSWLLGLTKPLVTVPDLPGFHDLEAREISLRDLILLLGGLFLIYKSVREMHEKLEAARTSEDEMRAAPKVASFGSVLVQIAVLDIVFSLDSVITAVGMVDSVPVMIAAMIIAMIVMLIFAGSISAFVAKHPTIKVLALAFLILIGVMLVAESLGQHIDKGYIYFAMAFAVVLEMINLRLRGSKHVKTAPAVPL